MDSDKSQAIEPKLSSNPWLFVPVLYFLQAIPVSLVQDVSPVLFKDFGVSNESIAKWTSIIALPWALQMMVGPMVDLNWTKRKWVLGGESIMAFLIGGIGLSLASQHAYGISLAMMLALAAVSTLTNTAMDGFYILSLPKDQQAKFAGVQTTCYRFGALFCKGWLVILAGGLETRFGIHAAWLITFLVGCGFYGVGMLENRWALPRPRLDVEKSGSGRESGGHSAKQTIIVISGALAAYFALSSVVKLLAQLAWKIFDGTQNGPLRGWILPNNPKVLGLSVGNNGVLAEIIQLIVCVGLLGMIQGKGRKAIQGTEFARTFSTYFANKGILAILAFLMFYRFGEAMVAKMSPLFIKDSVAKGGLGLSTVDVGLIKGQVGVFGIVFGGLLGGYVVGKYGLRRCFWIIAILMHIPNFLYLWASYAKPGLIPMYFVDFSDQFGYGFGFAGYIIFQMSVARRGSFPTAHYALGVGIGALFISVAGVFSGIVQGNFGWHWFYISVILMTIPGLLTLFFIPLDESSGPLAQEATA